MTKLKVEIFPTLIPPTSKYTTLDNGNGDLFKANTLSNCGSSMLDSDSNRLEDDIVKVHQPAHPDVWMKEMMSVLLSA